MTRSESSPGKCTQCNCELTPENWCNTLHRGKLTIRSWCRECTTKQNAEYRAANRYKYNQNARQRRHERKQRAIEYKGGVCEYCKGRFHSAAFDFHHLDPNEKDKDPGLMMSMSDENLFKELDKCILLCANCHRVHHFKELWTM